jgi:hypothetical protein
VTAAWHGAVYGTAGDKPLVLDAKTGVDREPSPGLAPAAVSGYAGFVGPGGRTAGSGAGRAAAVSLL